VANLFGKKKEAPETRYLDSLNKLRPESIEIIVEALSATRDILTSAWDSLSDNERQAIKDFCQFYGLKLGGKLISSSIMGDPSEALIKEAGKLYAKSEFLRQLLSALGYGPGSLPREDMQ
jgi:hypothetical protein